MGTITRYGTRSLCVEKKPFLSPLWSEEGGGDQQMTPELLNEAFSEKATRLKP